MTQTKIYGHRGCKGTFPENTLLGYQKAIDAGADGLEIDVQMTKDGKIIVIHDEMLDRTTDGSGYVKNHTLAELKQFSAGIKFSDFPKFEESWIAERIPTLQEVLDLLAPYPIELNIELKTSVFAYEGIEEKVLSLVNKYGKGRKVIYSSFHLPSLIRMKKLDPAADIAWLLNIKIPQANDYLQTLELEGLHLEKAIVLDNPNYFHSLYHKLRVWTVNDSDEIKQLLDLQVNSIITDFPEKAIALKNEHKSFA
ncbi:glycerophosphodiester phosphodiesterase [Bacillaceae bacterium Marseille-Q3522]|nr:glycerophosphodiester phosphodiesterase [Bacillaceae bacterium Marseille-Q3522]